MIELNTKLNIKLFSGFVCQNRELSSYGQNKFVLEVPLGTTLAEVHKLLKISSQYNLVYMVNGQAQTSDYVLNKDSNISVFLPMGDRRYDLFARLK